MVLGSSSHGGERKRSDTSHNSTYEWETIKGVGPKRALLSIKKIDAIKLTLIVLFYIISNFVPNEIPKFLSVSTHNSLIEYM